MQLAERIELLAELGDYLQQEPDQALESVIRRTYAENRWFTETNVRAALKAIAGAFLDRDKLTSWLEHYSIGDTPNPRHAIGLVMAGNIPLVGFHDWLCIFAAGERAVVKLSNKDKHLFPFLIHKMGDWAYPSRAYTELLAEEEKLRNFDAVIATGSNNTARYFEQYFRKYPHIIRRNRNGVAVLTGKETAPELFALGSDIFTYFGLGCRNVSKLYVPRGYDFNLLLETLHEYNDLIHHDKYKNNFDYNMTLFILNNLPYYNNGCLLLREDRSLQSRIASLHFEHYTDSRHLTALLEEQRDEIQCVVGNMTLPGWTFLPFGATQEPGLTDYPDGVDIMTFITSLAP